LVENFNNTTVYEVLTKYFIMIYFSFVMKILVKMVVLSTYVM